MATKKDLVEAHSFSRRRLVTAFLSGAPGGREVEPSRPGRTIVGGIALSILLVAGAAIASVLAARTPEDWNKQGLVVSRENAALYVILKQQDPPVLLPILNVTSAQLIFGADATPTYVSRKTINEQTPGDTIGIFNAPAELPTTDGLIETGWTACTGDNLGIKLDLDRERRVSPGTGSAFVVQTTDDQKYYLITTGRDEGGLPRARYYPIPDGTDDNLFADLGLPVRSEAMKVPGAWLRLFEPGGTLGWEGFGIPDPGAPLPAALAQDQLAKEKAKVGDYIEGSDGQGTVLTSQGPVTLDPFALAVYRNSQVPGTGSTPRPLPADTEIPPGAGFGQRAYLGAHWPDRALETPPGQACAVLTPTYGDTPAVQLAVDPTGTASAEDVRPDTKVVRVQPGNGAFVYSGTFAEKASSTASVVDAKGDIYPLIGATSIVSLGYSEVKAPLVPDTWTSLFDPGVDLSTTQALCPPVSEGEAPDQTCATRDTSGSS